MRVEGLYLRRELLSLIHSRHGMAGSAHSMGKL